MTPSKALAHIAAVLDHEGAAIEPATYATLRAVLVAVAPETGSDMPSPLTHPGDMPSSGPESYTSGGVLDRDQARAVLFDYQDGTKDTTEALDALAGCVRPAAIDRAALVMLLDGWEAPQPLHLADAILALVRAAEATQ